MEQQICISATAFRLPEHYVTVGELRDAHEPALRRSQDDALRIPKLKQLALEEIDGVHVFNGEEEGALALASIRETLNERRIEGKDVGLLIDYSAVSRAKNGISLCYKLQRDLEANNAVTLAIGNGSCASLQLAIQTAVAFLKSNEEIEFALLFAEDRIRGRRFQPPFNILGDGASAVLIERGGERWVIAGAAYQSLGKFCDVLGINHWEEGNFNWGEFENKIVPIHYKITRDLVFKVLEKQGLELGQVDLILYQNMSYNDYRGLAAALDVAMDRTYLDGLKGHGHIFGSDLVINLSMASRAGRLRPGGWILLISSGAGFSWGVTLVKT